MKCCTLLLTITCLRISYATSTRENTFENWKMLLRHLKWIHFLRGAPWWVTWWRLRYHLFFTFFWQISHWSSFPTVCIFKICWNGWINNVLRLMQQITCLRLNLLLNILWQYWHILGCLDFQEGPSRAAIWSGPSRAAIWSAALDPSTLWQHNNVLK